MLEANIPLERADESLIKWLNKYMTVLRESYVPRIAEEIHTNLKRAVENHNVVILCDETTDRMGRDTSTQCVYVGTAKELESANGTECPRTILSVMSENGIKYEHIAAIVSDYSIHWEVCELYESYFLRGYGTHSVLGAQASSWGIALPELNKCVHNAKQAFLNTPKRKHRYITFLNTKLPHGKKKALRFPITHHGKVEFVVPLSSVHFRILARFGRAFPGN
ncbi:hypothetical protein PR048_021835 [Dryococelus australis]|uniref:Transposase n=1 Tax=Dryococelus australis TaxID=614101 RepID=A0ABQ9GZA7_9NEOP|nr:hypothetical protein PR048_021835 [Dryococelus australis]